MASEPEYPTLGFIWSNSPSQSPGRGLARSSYADRRRFATTNRLQRAYLAESARYVTLRYSAKLCAVERMLVPVIRILSCPFCGAALPIGDGDEARFRHCGAVRPLPDEYRALRDAARSDAGSVAAAERLYQRLAMPAGATARRLSSDALLAKMAATLLPLSLIGLVVWGTRFHLWLSARLHRNIFQTFDWWTLFAAHLGPILLALLPLFIWLTLGERHAAARSLLRAALAALPPATPGGSYLCRRCGAPLTVAPSALGAACLYCRAHNLLQPTEHHSWEARRSAIVGAMDDAAQLEAWERRSVRASVLQRSTVVLALVAIAVGFYSLSWPRQFLPRWTTWQTELERRIDEQRSLRLNCSRSEGYYRGKDWCQSHLTLALRHGERVSFRLVELPGRRRHRAELLQLLPRRWAWPYAGVAGEAPSRRGGAAAHHRRRRLLRLLFRLLSGLRARGQR